MAKLTSAERKQLPSSDFAEPKERKYPMEDRAHAQNALSRVSQFGSSKQKSLVRAKAARKFGMGKGKATK